MVDKQGSFQVKVACNRQIKLSQNEASYIFVFILTQCLYVENIIAIAIDFLVF